MCVWGMRSVRVLEGNRNSVALSEIVEAAMEKCSANGPIVGA